MNPLVLIAVVLITGYGLFNDNPPAGYFETFPDGSVYFTEYVYPDWQLFVGYDETWEAGETRIFLKTEGWDMQPGEGYSVKDCEWYFEVERTK